MKVEIMSRAAVEGLLAGAFPNNTAVVSFYDPTSKRTLKAYAPLDYAGSCARLFSVCVHDIDLEVLGDFGLCYETYLPEANELARFILEVERGGLDILCQCEYGQSRSAACAAAILEYFCKDGISIFAD